MSTVTESGSGGSGVGVITGFEEAGEGDDYDRQLAQVRLKVEGLTQRSQVEWLGLQAVRPSLDLHSPSEAANLYIPLPNKIIETSSLYN